MLATDIRRQVQRSAVRVWIGVFPVGLSVIVLAASVLRFWSIDFGLPLVTHPDEPLIFDAADQMVSSPTLNPGWFRYPAFIIDIEAAILALVYALDTLVGLSADTVHSLGYGGGRIVMAGFGIATVALTGLLGRRLTFDALADDDPEHPQRVEMLASIAGLVAATLLAVSFIHVKDSHYLKPDIPTGFFTTLTLWFAVKPLPQPPPLNGEGAFRTVRPEASSPFRGGGWGSGFPVGLAAAAKYTGAVVAVVPAAALLLDVLARRCTFRTACRSALGMAAVAVGVFLLFNPYVLLAPGEFLSPVDGIRAELNHYRTGHDGAEGNDSWLWYLGEVWRGGFGPTLTPLVALGGVMAIRQIVAGRSRPGTRGLWLVLVFVPIYYATIARYPVRFDRQLIPILPYLALLGGFGVTALLALAQARRPARRGVDGVPTIAVTLLLVGLLAAPQAIRSTDWDIQTGKPDTRYAALAWIEANIPPGTTIAREWHTPPVEQAGYDDIVFRSTAAQPLGWYRAGGAEYLVVSSYLYARYLDAPDTYPAEAAFYQRLLALRRVATFEGENGPVLIIYRIEDAAPAWE